MPGPRGKKQRPQQQAWGRAKAPRSTPSNRSTASNNTRQDGYNPRDASPQHVVTKRGGFVKISNAPSFKYQHNENRRKKAQLEEERYLTAPPPDQELLDARLVIPGKHMLPLGLDNPAALNDICKSHKAWITRVENVIQIRSETMPGLKAALKAVNQAIHDMRLSNDHLSSRFLVQGPSQVQAHASIRVLPRIRPHVPNPALISTTPTLPEASLTKLCAEFGPSFGALTVLDKHLKMSVTFGQFIVHRIKEQDISYDSFSDMTRALARRGGAGFCARLPDVELARQAVQVLTSPELEICGFPDEVTYNTSLELVLTDGRILQADIVDAVPGELQFSTERLLETERCPRLDWTVSAPDMKLDWNLRVDASAMLDIPADLRAALRRISLSPGVDAGMDSKSFTLPRLFVPSSASIIESKVEMSRLKVSATIPFIDPQYMVDVSVTADWKGLRQAATPISSWGIEFYGIHWDEALNHVSGEDGRKDWGEGFRDIWPGGGDSLEDRVRYFLQNILEVQRALERLSLAATDAQD